MIPFDGPFDHSYFLMPHEAEEEKEEAAAGSSSGSADVTGCIHVLPGGDERGTCHGKEQGRVSRTGVCMYLFVYTIH